jgi:hypothetical protein
MTVGYRNGQRIGGIGLWVAGSFSKVRTMCCT